MARQYRKGSFASDRELLASTGTHNLQECARLSSTLHLRQGGIGHCIFCKKSGRRGCAPHLFLTTVRL